MNLKPQLIYVQSESDKYIDIYSVVPGRYNDYYNYLDSVEPQTKIVLSEEEYNNNLADFGEFLKGYFFTGTGYVVLRMPEFDQEELSIYQLAELFNQKTKREVMETKEIIKNNIKWSSKKPSNIGGQSCGMPNYPVILTSEELDLEITIGYHRSQIKNKELAFTLFSLALDELIPNN